MRRLRSLRVGDLFRIARAEELSMARQVVRRDQVLEVVKIYQQQPYAVVSRDVAGTPTTFSLLPDVATIDPDEPPPSSESVVDEFLGRVPTARVVGFELMWDGKVDISKLSVPSCRRIIEIWRDDGRRVLSLREFNRMLDEVPREEWDWTNDPKVEFGRNCRTRLRRHGLIREILGRGTRGELGGR